MGNWSSRISWIVLLAWMGVIFYLSAQPGNVSGDLSLGITETVLRLIERLWPGTGFDVEAVHYFVRKNAHFIAYLIMGVLAMNAVGRSRWFVDRAGNIQKTVTALALCVLYAISDEFHQLFVPGRSGQWTDVLIDSAGAVTGIALFWIVRKSYAFLFDAERS